MNKDKFLIRKVTRKEYCLSWDFRYSYYKIFLLCVETFLSKFSRQTQYILFQSNFKSYYLIKELSISYISGNSFLPFALFVFNI